FTLNIPELRGGVSLVAALIGVFAVPQVLSMILNLRKEEYVAEYKPEKGVILKTIIKVVSAPIHFLRSGVIGAFIGILPGAGSPIAAIVSYNEALRWSKDKSQYGKGDVRGVTASEIANNAAAPAAMIPLVTLGVPGSAPAAVIAGALMLRGLNPGPELFGTNATLVYSFGWSLLIAGIVVFFIGMLATPILVRIIKIPLRLLAPLIMFLAIIGAYAIRNNVFDVYLMLIIGLFVFLIRPLGFHPGPIGLGFILGPIIEPSLVQALYISHAVGVQRVFFSGSVSIILISLSVISVSAVAISRYRSRKKENAS
ncbi:MAG: tripartite tricarboxylate transporter permease, partial [Pseudomonadota bacterium]|nr:tripartite tricarboxylate transporter permease [Pseudomonadota bacterium]